MAILLIGTLVYLNSLSNPFILDDQRSILENAQIRQLWPLSEPLSPPDETPVARRPLVNLSFAVNYALHGLDVRGYRAGNLIVHLLTALVLFGVVRRTLALASLRDRFGEHAIVIAAVSAAVWTVHPLNSEVVNYISQRTTALRALFYLLTMYCSVRALSRAPHWRAAAVMACAAGMACKESMVTAPVLVMLFDRTYVFDSWRSALRERRTLYWGLAGTWLVLWGLMASGARTTVGFQTGVSPWTYLLNQANLLVDYLALTVWPRDLVVDYGSTTPVSLRDSAAPLAIVSTLLAGALISMRMAPRAGFLCVSFFVLLAPTSSVVPIATEVGAERRMYLPLAAVTILVACLVYRAGIALIAGHALRALPRKWLTPRTAGWTTASVTATVCLALAAGTVLRNREYRSKLTLAQVTVERRPHGRAHYALGHALLERGERREALRHLQRATADFPPARFALGTELLADGEFHEGMQQLRGFVALMPNHPAVIGAHQLMASALFDRGEYMSAAPELETIIRLQPRNARARALLGELWLREQRPAEAAEQLEQAAALQPANTAVRVLLGHALASQRRFADAELQFRRVLQLQPTHPEAQAAIGELARISTSMASERVVQEYGGALHSRGDQE